MNNSDPETPSTPPSKKMKSIAEAENINIAARKLMLKRRENAYNSKVSPQDSIAIEVEDDKSSKSCPTKSKFWIKINKFELTQEDQQIILCPTGWLNDKIISAAQCLLKNESNAEGLEESTAGLAYSFKLKKGEYLRILFNGTNHWTLVSNIQAQDKNDVYVYDSYYPCVSMNIKNQLF